MKAHIQVAHFDTFRFVGLMEMMEVAEDGVKVAAACALLVLMLCGLH